MRGTAVITVISIVILAGLVLVTGMLDFAELVGHIKSMHGG